MQTEDVYHEVDVANDVVRNSTTTTTTTTPTTRTATTESESSDLSCDSLWWQHYEPGVRLLRIRKSLKGTYGFHLTRSKWDPYPWVSDVDVGTPAYVCGLKPGDCILEVNGEDVLGLRIGDVAGLVRAKSDADRDANDAALHHKQQRTSVNAITLLVWRNGAGSTANKCQPQGLCCGPMPRSLQRLSLVVQAILSLIECPVCMDTITPPTMQCQNGHLLCLPCRIRAEKCPVCRECYTPRRALTAEQIYAAIANGFEIGSNERKLRELVFNGSGSVSGTTIGNSICNDGLGTVQLPTAIQANVATADVADGLFKYLPHVSDELTPRKSRPTIRNRHKESNETIEQQTITLKNDLQTLRNRAAGSSLSVSSLPSRLTTTLSKSLLSGLAARSAPSLLYAHKRRPNNTALELRSACVVNGVNGANGSSSRGSSSSGVYSSSDDDDLCSLSCRTNSISSAVTLPIGDELTTGEDDVIAVRPTNASEVRVDNQMPIAMSERFLCPCACGQRFNAATALRQHIGTSHRLPILSFGVASAQLALPLRAPLDDCVLVLVAPQTADNDETPKECWIRLRSQPRQQQQQQQQQQKQGNVGALKTNSKNNNNNNNSNVTETDIEVSALLLANVTESVDFVMATRLSGNKVDKAFSDVPPAATSPTTSLLPSPPLSPSPTTSPPSSQQPPPSLPSSATTAAASTTSSSASSSLQPPSAEVTAPSAMQAAALNKTPTQMVAADVSVMQLPSANNAADDVNNANGQQHQQPSPHQYRQQQQEYCKNVNSLFEMRSIVHSMETTTWQATFEQHQQQQQQLEQQTKDYQHNDKNQQDYTNSNTNNNNNNRNNGKNNAMLTRRNDLNVISVMQQACQLPAPKQQQQQQHEHEHEHKRERMNDGNDVDLLLHIDVLHRLN